MAIFSYTPISGSATNIAGINIPSTGITVGTSPSFPLEAFVGVSLNRKINGVTNNLSDISGFNLGFGYSYTILGNTQATGTVNGVSIPSGGTAVGATPLTALETYVGVSVDRYVDGVLDNGSIFGFTKQTASQVWAPTGSSGGGSGGDASAANQMSQIAQETAIAAALAGTLTVKGAVSTGSAAASNPIGIAGQDPSGNKQHVQLDSLNHLYVNPNMSGGACVSVQTAATGANWATFGSAAAKQLTIVNNTGVSVDVTDASNVSSGVYAGQNFITVPSGQTFPLFGLSNATGISVRRNDQSATQVYVQARAEY